MVVIRDASRETQHTVRFVGQTLGRSRRSRHDRSKAHDEALQAAVAEVRSQFHRRKRCGKCLTGELLVAQRDVRRLRTGRPDGTGRRSTRVSGSSISQGDGPRRDRRGHPSGVWSQGDRQVLSGLRRRARTQVEMRAYGASVDAGMKFCSECGDMRHMRQGIRGGAQVLRRLRNRF